MTTLPRWYRKIRAKFDAIPAEAGASAPPAPAEIIEAIPADCDVKSHAVLPPAESVAAAAPPDEARAAPAAAAPPNTASRLFEAKRRTVPTLVHTAKAAMARAGAASAGPWQRPAIAAAALVLAGGLGYGGGVAAGKRGDGELVAAQRIGEAASDIRQSREEAVRLAAEMKSMRIAVDALKGERDRTRSDLVGKQAQLSDRVEKSTAETTGRIGKVSEQLDRIEKTQRDPARIASLVDRLDRIERQMQVASASPGAPTPPPKPVATLAAPGPDVTTTGSLPDPKLVAKPVEPDHRKIQVEGYVLRDIDDGVALIEGRNGRYFEVSPGMILPGIGRVEAIERRGRQWVVVTPKGFIAER